jgi:hypothetical protein
VERFIPKFRRHEPRQGWAGAVIGDIDRKTRSFLGKEGLHASPGDIRRSEMDKYNASWACLGAIQGVCFLVIV